MIRQVDLMLASNATIDYGPYQPQIAAQLKSLFETAYLCNMLPSELVRYVYVHCAAACTGACACALHRSLCSLAPEPEAPEARTLSPSSARTSSAEPPPPAPERIAPRTAAFLAEIRKQIFPKGEAAEPPDAPCPSHLA